LAAREVTLTEADYLRRRGRYAEAVRLLAPLEDDLQAGYVRAWCLARLDEDPRALAEFERVTARDPDGARGLDAAAIVALSTPGGAARALALARRAQALAPHDVHARLTLAAALAHT